MPFGLAIIVLMLLAGAARADEIVLANGDRLTGTVLRKEGEELVFRTEYAGELKIAWGQIVRISTSEPMSLVLSDQSLAQANTVQRPERLVVDEGASHPGFVRREQRDLEGGLRDAQ